jgi:signal transduction histidine kinase/ActR/RegA family two-component response regulator
MMGAIQNNLVPNLEQDLPKEHVLIVDSSNRIFAALVDQSLQISDCSAIADFDLEPENKFDAILVGMEDLATNDGNDNLEIYRCLIQLKVCLKDIPLILVFARKIDWERATALSKEFTNIERVTTLSEIAIVMCDRLKQSHQIKTLKAQLALLSEKISLSEQQNWLISYNRQKLTIDIVNRLRDEIAARIHQHLNSYLALPPKINQLSINAISLGSFSLNNFAQIQKYLWHQLQIFPDINAIQVATEDGEYVGAIRMEDGSFSVEIKDSTTGLHKIVYALDERGDRIERQVGISPNYFPQNRHWYRAAKEKGCETWGEMYQYSSNTTVQIGIMAVQPMYDRIGKLLAVWGTDITPWQISDFLKTIEVGHTGLTFVMERSGEIVASSTIAKPFSAIAGKAIRANAFACEDRSIRGAAEHLRQCFGDFEAIGQSEKTEFDLDGQKQFLQVSPFQDGRGIDWLVAIILPEADFTESNTSDIRSQISEAFKAKDKLYKQLEEQVNQRTAELQKAKEAAEIANRTKSDFLAKMSHELRTPLNAILGFTQLMIWDKEMLNAKHQKQIQTIYDSGNHLLSLINDILEMSKIEAGKIELNKTCVNLPDLLNNLRNMMLLKAEEKGLTFILEIADWVPQFIQSDELKLRQILLNLLSNAIKFTDAGSVALRVSVLDSSLDRASEVASREIQLSFVVEDTGYGISQKDLDTIFEPFTQTESGKKSQEGTGLGLSISRNFARLMRGQIRAISELGKGTTFTFVVPVELGDRDLGKAQINSQNADPQKLQDLKILLAEDNPTNQIVALKMLEKMGCKADVANNGLEVLEILKSKYYDLILMDIQMPEMDGLETTRQIQKLWEVDRRPAIVALSANAMKADRDRCLAAGMVDHIGKPIHPEELRRVLERSR